MEAQETYWQALPVKTEAKKTLITSAFSTFLITWLPNNSLDFLFLLPCIYRSFSCCPSHPSLFVISAELCPFKFHPCITRYLFSTFIFYASFWHLTQSGWLPAMPTQFYAYWMECCGALIRLSWKINQVSWAPSGQYATRSRLAVP